MKTMPINNVYSDKHYLNFNGYKESFYDAMHTKFNYSCEVSSAMRDLCGDLLTTAGTKIYPIFNILDHWLMDNPVGLVKELSKPIAEVKPELRNLVFDADRAPVTILKGENNSSVSIHNCGKQGLLGALFNRQDAMNDMHLLFTSQGDYLDLSTQKNKFITLQQGHDRFWEKLYFQFSSGLKQRTISGGTNLPFTPPLY